MPWPDPDTRGSLEHAVLGHLGPPLNLAGMRPTPVRSRLRHLRSRLGDGGSGDA